MLAAIDDILAPAPVILTATEISQTIEQAAEAKTQDLGAFSLTGISLAIDGLDEIGATRMQSLMEEALILAKAYPRSAFDRGNGSEKPRARSRDDGRRVTGFEVARADAPR